MTKEVHDTNVWIDAIRDKSQAGQLYASIRAKRAYLCSVVATELYVGTTSIATAQSLDNLLRDFAIEKRLLVPGHDDWVLAARLINKYQRDPSFGEVEYQDHIADVLIAICAARANATLFTTNVDHMETWAKYLQASGLPLKVRLYEP